MKPKRYYFEDEEPEVEYIELRYIEHTGCTWCGQEGHAYRDCASRPYQDWLQKGK